MSLLYNTKRYVYTGLMMLVALSSYAQHEAAYQKVRTATNQQALLNIAEREATLYEKNKAAALAKAQALGWPIREELSDGRIIELQGLDATGAPIYYTTHNLDAARSTQTDELWTGGSLGLSLNGQGLFIAAWDGGATRLTHQEFGGRALQMDGASTNSSHATHVGGTIVASGVEPTAKGMAPEATLHAYAWGNDNAEMATAASNGLLISNHSYGTIAGWHNGSSGWRWYGNTMIDIDEDSDFGYYSSKARSWDDIAFNAPYYLIVKSAGNDRGDEHSGSHDAWNGSGWVTSSDVRPPDGGALGYDCVTTNGNAKNILTVGATEDVSNHLNPSSVSISSFSGWGPTDDGRIKPDIVGNGVSVYSCDSGSDTDYSNKSGTSMSGPNVAGSLLLLQEHYSNLHGQFMLSATLKALALHTAFDAGRPGPDYVYGWGLLNARKAAELITEPSSQILEENLGQGNTYVNSFYNNGSRPIRLTIAWTDPSANPVASNVLNNPNPRLINDLDIRLIDEQGQVFHPYVLNPAQPNATATTGDNVVDNVEQVYLALPAAGRYIVEVSHKGLLVNNEQNFSLILEGETPPALNDCLRWYDAWTHGTPNGTSFGSRLCVDSSGILSLAGRFTDTLLIGNQALGATGIDLFLSQYHPNGQLRWSQKISSSDTSAITGLTYDAQGNIYITGYYTTILELGTQTLGGSNNRIQGFVAKLDSLGNLSWLQQLGSNTELLLFDLVLDQQANVYAVGRFSGSATLGNQTLNATGSSDALLFKLSSAGQFLWWKKWGGTGMEAAAAVDVSSTGHIAVGGYFDDHFTLGVQSVSATGAADVFISQFDNVGNPIWNVQANGLGTEYISALAIDDQDRIFAAGVFNNNIQLDTTSRITKGDFDAFVLQLDDGGTAQWLRSWGGVDDENVQDLRIQGQRIALGGSFGQSALFEGLYDLESAGGRDGWVLNIDPLGNNSWWIPIGGTFNDAVNSLAWHQDKLYVTGYFDGNIQLGDTSLTQSSPIDLFVASLGVPQPIADAGSNQTVACQTSTSLQGSSNLSNVDFNWSPAGVMLNANSPYPSLNPTSSQFYTLQVTDACGQVATDQVYVEVDSSLNTYADAGPDLSIICGESIVLQGDKGTSFASASWTPNIQLNSPNIVQPVATPDTSRIYVFTVSNTCGFQQSDSVFVEVLPLPTPVINPYGSLLTSSAADNYQWFHNGDSIAAATSQQYQVLVPGFYHVATSSDNGCTATSLPTEVLTVDVQAALQTETALRLYPNPNSGAFYLDTRDLPQEAGQIRIFNTLGEQVAQRNWNQEIQELRLPELQTGMYILQLYTESGAWHHSSFLVR